ncbi:MAG: hypothetical protein QM739_14320 [Propionivibrio sp.]
MLSGLLHLLTSDTALVIEHASAYAELAVAESRDVVRTLRRRLLLQLLAAAFALLGGSRAVHPIRMCRCFSCARAVFAHSHPRYLSLAGECHEKTRVERPKHSRCAP